MFTHSFIQTFTSVIGNFRLTQCTHIYDRWHAQIRQQKRRTHSLITRFHCKRPPIVSHDVKKRFFFFFFLNAYLKK